MLESINKDFSHKIVVPLFGAAYAYAKYRSTVDEGSAYINRPVVPMISCMCVHILNVTLYVCGKVDVLKFRTQVACQKGLDKQSRPRLDCFFRCSLI